MDEPGKLTTWAHVEGSGDVASEGILEVTLQHDQALAAGVRFNVSRVVDGTRVRVIHVMTSEEFEDMAGTVRRMLDLT
jgi:hypothetical protein